MTTKEGTPAEEEKTKTWQERFLSSMSAKADAHHHMIELDNMKEHNELWKQPHLRTFFSSSFKDVMSESKNYCNDSSILKMKES